MGHIFRIKSGQSSSKSTIVDWDSKEISTYNAGNIEKIQEATSKQKEITSIPSPFARIELVKEAFEKVTPDRLESLSPQEIAESLHGNTIYHKMVSDSLDVAQIFFCYPSMQDKVDIVVWNKDESLSSLNRSSNPEHRIIGKTLGLFLHQDKKAYHFDKMGDLYILKYKGAGHRSMHIIGATSPATLFFSTANDESKISKELCFGTDYAFDTAYASLDQRDPDFVKYLYTFRASCPNFTQEYPEVHRYLEAVYDVLPENLKKEVDSAIKDAEAVVAGTPRYIDKTYEKLSVNVDSTTSFNVQINGMDYHCKKAVVAGHSDFEIAATKSVETLPLVLPVVRSNEYEKLEYYGCQFGRSFDVPNENTLPLTQRHLPGINVKYPYLTISDFLDDKIVQLPGKINSNYYFDGNYSNKEEDNKGFLLPIKDAYFDYFTSDELTGFAPSGEKTIEIKPLSASAVDVILRIPIKNGKEVKYKRTYNFDVKADASNNKGAIVKPDDVLGIGVLPPVKFEKEQDAHYRIVIMSLHDVNKGCSCSCYSNTKGDLPCEYVVRNANVKDDLSSKVYLLDGQSFDYARINLIASSGKEKAGSGLMIPNFEKRTGSKSLTFAIDLGTSNTHIEYTPDSSQLSKPFEFGSEQPQMSLLFDTDDAMVQNHKRAEFVPEAIGSNSNFCKFPMRTVLCVDKVRAGSQGTNVPYIPFGNASPAFLYNQNNVSQEYSEYVPNLKWSGDDEENRKRVRSYIESLFMMIRAKVVQEGAVVDQTKIKWFYPISMSKHRRGMFNDVWKKSYKKFFDPEGEPIAISESIAPYRYFQSLKSNVTNIVTIDIGGGTTDIVVADESNDDDNVKLVTSMRFAADAIFGNGLATVRGAGLNGLIKSCISDYREKLSGSTEKDKLRKLFDSKIKDGQGDSSEVASFLFSLSENSVFSEDPDSIDFNVYLRQTGKFQVVFFLFYTSIIYYLAHLMKAKLDVIPSNINIAFSGNGSKVITVLSLQQESLEKLTSRIFSIVCSDDSSKGSSQDFRVNLIINDKNPKEATCKGGLILEQEPANLDEKKCFLWGVDKNVLATNETYKEVQADYTHFTEDVEEYWETINKMYENLSALNLRSEFGIEKDSWTLLKACFNEPLETYVEKGVNIKLRGEVSKDELLEETLFFYPIIGVINNLCNKIYEKDH